MLRHLISTRVDRRASERRLLVSAILLGGNVLVRTGQRVGGDFKHGNLLSIVQQQARAYEREHPR